jgi:hypothetical protein
MGVELRVDLAGLVGMVVRMEAVRVGDVGVVGRLLMVARRMRLGCRMMVPGGLLMMRRRVPVMLDLSLV